MHIHATIKINVVINATVQLLNPLKYILICFGQIFSLTVVHAIS